MSGTTGHNVTALPVRTSITGVTLIGFEAGGVPVALDPTTIPGAAGGGGVSLSNSPGAALGTVGSSGTATTAARADHVHPRPTAAQVGAAPVSHGHSIADVIGLRTELDDLAEGGGAALSNTPAQPLGTAAAAGVSLEAARADHVHIRPTASQIGAAAASHTHGMADVTGLATALAAKQDTSARGQPNGYAPLGADARVPAANLPASLSTANLQSGTVTGQVAVWDNTDGRYEPQTMEDITGVRFRAVPVNSATALTFAAHNNSIVILTALAPTSLAATEVGTAPDQGFATQLWNRHTAVNTLTFGAGITVERMAGTSGTGQSVNVAARGVLTVVVAPAGGTLVAVCNAAQP